MMKTFVCKSNKILKDVSLKKIGKYLKDKKATVWVDMEKPTDAEYSLLKETFNFHPLSIDDCKKSIDLPKIDVFEDYIFIVLHSVSVDFEKLFFKKRELDFFLGKNFLITLHSHDSPSIERLHEKLENIKGTGKTADFLMYEIIDYFVDLYFPLIDHLEDYVEEMEAAIISQKPPKNVLKEIMRVKREVIHLKKSIAPQRDVINKLARRDFPYIHPLTGIYFRDVYDHIMRIHTELETERDLINTAFEAHMSVLSNQMMLISNRMNQVMQKLTIIATIFMPLTFITGIYGMNFQNMPELYWKYGYYIILGIMFFVGIIMYVFFRRKRWM